MDECYKRYLILLKFYMHNFGKVMKIILLEVLENPQPYVDDKPIFVNKLMTKKGFKKLDCINRGKLQDQDLRKVSLEFCVSNIILQELWPDYKTIGAEFDSIITSLKETKNDLCHEVESKYKNMSEKMLKREIEKIANNVVELLEIFRDKALLSSLDIDKLIEDFKNDCTNYLAEKNRNENGLIKLMNEFKRDELFQFIQQGREDLKEFFGDLEITTPCLWLNADDNDEENANGLPLSKVYVEPMLHFEGSSFDYKKLVNTKSSEYKTYSSNKVAVIHGQAGIGKTTLCQQIFEQWKDNGSHFDLVVFLRVKCLHNKDLESYIKQYLKNATNGKTNDQIKYFLKECRILYLVDGYDERSDEGVQLVKNLLKSLKKSNSRAYITTRDVYLEELQNLLKESQLTYDDIQINGFDETKLHEFCKKAFKFLDRDSKGFFDYLRTRGIALREHLQIPLTAAFLVLLWVNDPQIVGSITTTTELYYNVFSLLKRKLRTRCETLDDEKIHKTFMDLCGIACRSLSSKGIVSEHAFKLLTDKWVQEWNIDQSTVKNIFSAFLKVKSFPNGIPNTHVFIHRTQIEYMAAFYLVNSNLDFNAELELENDKTDVKKYENLFLYIVGNYALNGTLKECHIEKILSELIGIVKEDNFKYWWNLQLETSSRKRYCIDDAKPNIIMNGLNGYVNNHTQQQQFDPCLVSKLNEILSREEWKLNKNDVTEGLSLLCYTEIEIRELEITIESGKKPEEVVNFLEMLEKAQSKLKKRFTYEKKNNIKVRLHLCDHFDKFDKISDKYIIYLKPWAHVQELTGHIGTDAAAEVITKQAKLKHLNALLSSSSDYDALMTALKNKHFLKKVHLKLGFLSSLNNEHVSLQKIDIASASVEIIIPDLLISKEDYEVQLGKLNRILDNICPEQSFWKVDLCHSSIHHEHLRDLLEILNEYVHDKITFYSSAIIFDKPIDEEFFFHEIERDYPTVTVL